MYIVATRAKRRADYTAHSEYPDYGRARMAQLELSKRYYDAAVYSAAPYTRETLVYTHPRAQAHIENPYCRLERLFKELLTGGSYRCLVSHPAPGSGILWYRAYVFAYDRRYREIISTVDAIDLRADANVRRRYTISYDWSAAPPYRFEQGSPIVEPLTGARMRGVYLADVVDDAGLYFGYIESSHEEEPELVSAQAMTDVATLYSR